MKKRSTFGWLELLLGILLVALGILTFFNPGSALKTLVIAFGIVAIVGGIADIVLYVRLERRTGFGPVTSMISGIISVLLGIMLLFNVEVGMFTVSLIFPFWLMFHCISRLCGLNRIRFFGGSLNYWLSLISSVLGIIVSFMLLFSPSASMVTLSYLLGFYLLIAGVGSIIGACSKLGEGKYN